MRAKTGEVPKFIWIPEETERLMQCKANADTFHCIEINIETSLKEAFCKMMKSQITSHSHLG